MDLTTQFGDVRLKIRVAGIVSTPRGFLFEKSDKDYIFLMGGKVMVNETSEEAIKRELMEEIGMKVDGLTMVSIIENLYSTTDEKVHEISFIYKIGSIFNGILADGFVEVLMEDIGKFNIKPRVIVDILKNKDGSFRNFIIK